MGRGSVSCFQHSIALPRMTQLCPAQCTNSQRISPCVPRHNRWSRQNLAVAIQTATASKTHRQRKRGRPKAGAFQLRAATRCSLSRWLYSAVVCFSTRRNGKDFGKQWKYAMNKTSRTEKEEKGHRLPDRSVAVLLGLIFIKTLVSRND